MQAGLSRRYSELAYRIREHPEHIKRSDFRDCIEQLPVYAHTSKCCRGVRRTKTEGYFATGERLNRTIFRLDIMAIRTAGVYKRSNDLIRGVDASFNFKYIVLKAADCETQDVSRKNREERFEQK